MSQSRRNSRRQRYDIVETPQIIEPVKVDPPITKPVEVTPRCDIDTSETSTVINYRYSISALSKRHHEKARPEEIMIDKLTGEVLVKRPTGGVISYDSLDRSKSAFSEFKRTCMDYGVRGEFFICQNDKFPMIVDSDMPFMTFNAIKGECIALDKIVVGKGFDYSLGVDIDILPKGQTEGIINHADESFNTYMARVYMLVSNYPEPVNYGYESEIPPEFTYRKISTRLNKLPLTLLNVDNESQQQWYVNYIAISISGNVEVVVHNIFGARHYTTGLAERMISDARI